MPAQNRVAGLGRIVRARRADVAGVGALIALALAFLSPALKDGQSFGGFDLDTSLTPLGSGVYSVTHAVTNGDAVSQMVAWNDLSWRFIHSGQFPLWNPFSALGMPQFLNFESSVLSLPDLVSYLVPVRFAFLVVVFVKLCLASTGAYYFARVLGCRPLSSTFAGVAFMFAGAFSSWLTWPLTDVLAWSGWICAFGLCCVRPTGKYRHMVGLAVAVAFSIYGGFPEANVMLVLALACLVVVAVLLVGLQRRSIPLSGLVRASSGAVFGGLLAAPLWFPGLQVISRSHRTAEGSYVGLPTRSMALLFSQGYYNLPDGPNHLYQLPQFKYYEAVSYVGVIAVVLVIVAVGTSYRRPVVLGLTVALVFSIAMTYQPYGFHPLQSLVNSIPELKLIRFERMRTVTAFLVAMLAAVGLEQVLHPSRASSTRRWFSVGAVAVAFIVGYLDVNSALEPAVRHMRVGALAWPNICVLLCLGVAAYLWLAERARSGSRGVAVIATGLTVTQAAFLFFAGVGIASYSKPFFETTSAIAQLKSDVGNSLVGLNGGNVTNVRDFKDVGFYPNVNIGYGIRIFGVHDPMVPSAYFASWPIQKAAPNQFGVGLFVPDINSVALAQRYGIPFVLTKEGVQVPAGMATVAVIAGETLSRVPNSTTFSFLSGTGDRVLSSTSNGDGAWKLETDGSSSGTLALRVTAEPGFTATIDGRPLILSSLDDVMFEAHIPAGRHTITLKYLPARLELGVVAALAAVLAMLAAGGVVLARRRRL
jgi:Bacterial membrane protein YfhO